MCVLRVQSQVDEVIDVMQENISKVIERGERLDDLQDKSGESQQDTEDCSVSVSQTTVAQTLGLALNTHGTDQILPEAAPLLFPF